VLVTETGCEVLTARSQRLVNSEDLAAIEDVAQAAAAGS
jgi:hypothetical protein